MEHWCSQVFSLQQNLLSNYFLGLVIFGTVLLLYTGHLLKGKMNCHGPVGTA